MPPNQSDCARITRLFSASSQTSGATASQAEAGSDMAHLSLRPAPRLFFLSSARTALRSWPTRQIAAKMAALVNPVFNWIASISASPMPSGDIEPCLGSIITFPRYSLLHPHSRQMSPAGVEITGTPVLQRHACRVRGRGPTSWNRAAEVPLVVSLGAELQAGPKHRA